jgi:hypothetical protein
MSRDDEGPAGRDLARSPEATPEALLALAASHPDRVLANPALPLLSLEDPALYRRLVVRARYAQAGARLREAVRRLDAARRRRLAADCVEHALPLFEALFPDDARPRRLVEIARRYAERRASAAELRAAEEEAYRAAHRATSPAPDPDRRRALSAARAAVSAARALVAAADAGQAIRGAALAYALAAGVTVYYSAAYGFGPAGEDAEAEALLPVREWQLARAQRYLAEAGRG